MKFEDTRIKPEGTWVIEHPADRQFVMYERTNRDFERIWKKNFPRYVKIFKEEIGYKRILDDQN
jgi:hypothetical protein